MHSSASCFSSLAFMFPFISFSLQLNKHFQEDKSFSRLPCSCGNIVFLLKDFKQLSPYNSIIYSDLLNNIFYNSANRRDSGQTIFFAFLGFHLESSSERRDSFFLPLWFHYGILVLIEHTSMLACSDFPKA